METLSIGLEHFVLIQRLMLFPQCPLTNASETTSSSSATWMKRQVRSLQLMQDEKIIQILFSKKSQGKDSIFSS